MTEVAGWWRCRAIGPSGAPGWLAVVCSDRHPDGTALELPTEAAAAEVGAQALATATYDASGRVVRLLVGDRGAPTAPELWFGEITETAASPPAANLVAFTGHGVAAGTLLDAAALRGLVTDADQVGAVRWYPATGEVDQVYVQPDWRRRSIGNAIIAAASALTYARDWPRLWGDGQRTAIGERWRNASSWRARTEELTYVAPPMTPGDV